MCIKLCAYLFVKEKGCTTTTASISGWPFVEAILVIQDKLAYVEVVTN